MKNESYHYTECGLGNVFLKNGFRFFVVDGKREVHIEDKAGLHRAIGKRICDERFINGDEFKFLRSELGMTRERLGKVVGVSETMVYLWEKNSAIPRQAVAAIKALYLDYIQAHYQMMVLLDNAKREAGSMQQEIYAEYSDRWELPMAV